MDTGFDRFQGGSSWLGGFIYTLSESTTFTYLSTVGNFGLRGDGAINSFILSQNWDDNWQTVHQFDTLGTNGASDFGYDFGNGTATADNSTGLINYVFYTINDKVKAGARQEWYKADGTSYNTMTYGVNITPMDKLVIRPEVRHMWAPGATGAGGAGQLHAMAGTLLRAGQRAGAAAGEPSAGGGNIRSASRDMTEQAARDRR
jgi:hypothetical protein